MSWIQKLYRTYDFIQKQGMDSCDLALPFHMTKTAHLKIILNEKAELVSAERFDGRKQVAIQVTETSSKRSGSKIAPYALHDSLQYIAKNAKDYLTDEYITMLAKDKAGKKGGDKWQKFLTDSINDKEAFINSEKEKYISCFNAYEQQLSDWVDFNCLEEIKIVLSYIQKGTLIEDLIKKEVFSFENGVLLCNKEDVFNFTILWSVEMSNDPHADLWSKPCVQNDWISYQDSLIQTQQTKKDMCYITGELDYPTEAFLKIKGNAKLVSANDDTGFTFRGRFYGDKDNGNKSELASQALILGKNSSQKAFNMLKWLIENRGIENAKQIIIVWSSNCASDEDKLLSFPYQSNEDIYDILFADDNIDSSADLGEQTFQKLKFKLRGYQEKLSSNDRISILMLDETSKTGGRMSLTFYQEKIPLDYFDNLEAWQDDFSWFQYHKSKWVFWAPSLPIITQSILTKSEYEDKDKKAIKQLYSRLLPVISGGKSIPIPYDLVQRSLQNACNPYSGYNPKDKDKVRHENWQRNIGVACALYKGWRARHHDLSQRRTYTMSLDKENRSRDYLYGRLIAVAENLEWYAMYLQNGKKSPTRATNAERYFQRFAQYPYETWQQLEVKHLDSYKNYLTSLGKDFYKKDIGEIIQLFQHEDFISNEKLSGEFLLGYHCQKMEIEQRVNELRKKKSTKSDNQQSQ